MGTTKISVFLAVHNGEKYIFEAIQSVLSQTYQNFELLICANGCTDNTISIIETIKSDKIRLFVTDQANKSNALNYMLESSNIGEFIAIQDADDVWLPNKLEEQIKYIKAYDVIASKIEYIGPDSLPINLEYNIDFLHEKIVSNAFMGKNQIANCTSMVRTSIVKKVGGWNPIWDGVEDFDLWLKIMAKTDAKFTNLNQILAKHRIMHPESHFNRHTYNIQKLINQYL